VEHAELVIEAISSVIRDQEFDGLSITLSFGLIESDGNESLDELLKRVDALLYQAKAMGRDNVQTKLVP
jgi:PleD family two-component response regulator